MHFIQALGSSQLPTRIASEAVAQFHFGLSHGVTLQSFGATVSCDALWAYFRVLSPYHLTQV